MPDETPAQPQGEQPETPELTYGEKAVGKTFNPSGDDKVAHAKALCAELIDLVWDTATPADSRFLNGLRTAAINALVGAQMFVVKVLTWKE